VVVCTRDSQLLLLPLLLPLPLLLLLLLLLPVLALVLSLSLPPQADDPVFRTGVCDRSARLHGGGVEHSCGRGARRRVRRRGDSRRRGVLQPDL
jgi:hypothetical protein